MGPQSLGILRARGLSKSAASEFIPRKRPRVSVRVGSSTLSTVASATVQIWAAASIPNTEELITYHQEDDAEKYSTSRENIDDVLYGENQLVPRHMYTWNPCVCVRARRARVGVRRGVCVCTCGGWGGVLDMKSYQ